MGIDLGGDFVTANDALDTDTGPNELQNFPVITRARATNVEGTFHSAPNTTYTLQFFASVACHSSGHGPGQGPSDAPAASFMGSTSVITDASGNASFAAGSLGSASLGQFVTATATDPVGNTSEFSACALTSARFYTVSPCRALDTRGPVSVPMTAGEIRNVSIAGQCGVPATAQAVAANITVVDPTAAGHLTAFVSEFPPLASTLNYRAALTRANNAIAPLNPAGRLRLGCFQASGTTHVLIDVVGYFE